MNKPMSENRLAAITVHLRRGTFLDDDKGPWIQSVVADLLAEVDRLRAELSRLQSALPKTADGVAVVPGMMVWYRTGHHVVHRTVEMRAQLRNMACMSVSGCYSTREAAEAAKEPK